MIILGVNGWIERGHDASAALIVNGEPIYAVEEERLIREKHAYDRVPVTATQFCLDYAGISPDEIDKIGVSWNFPFLYKLHRREWAGSQTLSSYLFGSEEYAQKIEYVDHHFAHACGAYFPSGYNDALVLIIDGQGETFSTSLWWGEGSHLTFIKGYNVNRSFGYLYSAATKHAGFRIGDEGKTMGLSAYGSPGYKEFLEKIMYMDKNGELFTEIKSTPDPSCIDEEGEIIEQWHNHFEKQILPSKIPLRQVEGNQCYADLAASVQMMLQEMVVTVVTKYTKKLNTKNVCIAGGVGLNCQLNGEILSLPVVDNVFIQPAANDGGTSLGAALALCSTNGEDIKRNMNVYMGPEFNNKYIEQCIEKRGLPYRKCSAVEKETASLLAENKVIAVFQGRLEFGPRALGNRSVLADPSSLQIKDRVNVLKGRELWRPLAPSILTEQQEEYVSSGYVSPYMTIAFPVTNITVESAPAIVHVDKTARIQTVPKDHNVTFWNTIRHFEQLTDLPIVLNTSFNKRGEPIVCTPDDALNTFIKMKLDHLVMGSYIVDYRE